MKGELWKLCENRKRLASFHVSRFVFHCLFIVLLAGCAAMSPPTTPTSPARDALEAFQLEGRFSLRQDEQNHSGRLSWRHTARDDQLLLASPFGQGLAEIAAAPGQARLALSDGRVFAAADVPSLTESVLGYRLPLALLTGWIRGRAAGSEAIERDALGRPLRLRHEDWNVEYAYDGDDPEALPASLFAERIGAFELRLRIDEWSTLAGDE
jgi:outer membrane lipoprotein LolB